MLGIYAAFFFFSSSARRDLVLFRSARCCSCSRLSVVPFYYSCLLHMKFKFVVDADTHLAVKYKLLLSQVNDRSDLRVNLKQYFSRLNPGRYIMFEHLKSLICIFIYVNSSMIYLDSNYCRNNQNRTTKLIIRKLQR